MEITADRVKTLRERTGAGVMDCKRALEEAAGDFDKAIELIRQKGLAQAAKRAGREALQGVIETYVHGEGRIGVLVEVNCETDFVARTPDFRGLAHDVAMQIAATSPSVVGNEGDEISTSPDDLPLLQQPFIKNPGQTIGDLVRETVGKTGENIVIRRFARYELGS